MTPHDAAASLVLYRSYVLGVAVNQDFGARSWTVISLVLTWVLAAGIIGPQSGEADDAEQDKRKAGVTKSIKAVLSKQSDAWNKADLDGFMDHYWNSEELTFSSGGTTTRGWNATIARYERRYATPKTMGRLTFDHLEVTPLSDSAALVLGQWHLERATDKLGGNFSLVLRRIQSRWVIIHDHTSSLETTDN